MCTDAACEQSGVFKQKRLISYMIRSRVETDDIRFALLFLGKRGKHKNCFTIFYIIDTIELSMILLVKLIVRFSRTVTILYMKYFEVTFG